MTLLVTERKNPNALLELQRLIDGTLLAMAEVGADDLRENLSPGPRSGVHYPNNPRRSSAPGEFSQLQTGRLRGMVKAGLLTPGRAYFGLVPNGADEREQAEDQEFGNPGNRLIGRANVRRTAYAPRTQARMKAVRRPQ